MIIRCFFANCFSHMGRYYNGWYGLLAPFCVVATPNRIVIAISLMCFSVLAITSPLLASNT